MFKGNAMICVYVECNDYFSRVGLRFLLQSIFQESMLNGQLIAVHGMDKLAVADIVVVNFAPGEEFICHPEFLPCRPALLIGLMDEVRRERRDILPSCLRNMVFVQKTDKINRTVEKIKYALDKTDEVAPALSKNVCCGCRHRTFSPQQKIIAQSLLEGQNVNMIASEMSLCHKTVSAHKRTIMEKFKLRNDLELFLFIKRLQMYYPAVISEFQL
jgi:DNA-binding CsgD family transcriptional regulator